MDRQPRDGAALLLEPAEPLPVAAGWESPLAPEAFAFLPNHPPPILPELMRQEGFDMWLVICRENNEDPVYFCH
jgi:hypothetical protein